MAHKIAVKATTVLSSTHMLSSAFRIFSFLFLLICVSLPLRSASVIAVPADGDFQAALNNARPGDIITLTAGAVYVGNFVLPAKEGSDYITITSSVPTDFAPPGTRVTPASATNFPKLATPNGAPALATAPGAHHYRVVRIEILRNNGRYGNELVELGDAAATTLADQAHDLDLDRVYIHGDPLQGAKRGIGLNSASTTIENSYISDIKSTFQDSQAICGWNGPGPYTIVNNYLEAAGENLMFGGAPPSIPNLIPSDITIRGNHFNKPLSWKQDDPSYAGTLWSVKNLFELKNAQRVLVQGNIFENNWGQAQTGYALVLSVRAEFGAAPWAVVDTVTFINNIVRHTGSGVSILGMDDNSNNQGITRNLTFTNNLFDDVDGKKWVGGGWLFLIQNGAQNITIENNTALQSGTLLVADQIPSHGLVFRNNIMPLGDYGIFGSGQGMGTATLDYYFSPWVFSNNVLPGYSGYPPYPAGNFYPSTLSDVGFLDLQGGDYRLSPNSPFVGKGSDGRDPGANLDAILEATKLIVPHVSRYRIIELPPVKKQLSSSESGKQTRTSSILKSGLHDEKPVSLSPGASFP